MKAYTFNGRYIYKSIETYKGVKWECRGTSTKSKAAARESWKRARDNKRRQIDGETDRRDGNVPLGRELEVWYDLYKLRDGRTERTIVTDMDTIRQIQSSWLGKMKVAEITSDDIQWYLNEEAKEQMGSALRRKWLMLRMYYRHCSGDNPMERCTLPAPGKKRVEKSAYTDEEIERLTGRFLAPIVPGVSGMVYGPVLAVILYAFLRHGEVAGLRVGDVDLERGIIHIRRQWQEKVCAEVPPKYGSKRDVPISGRIREILEKRVRGQPPEELLFPAGEYNRIHSGDRHIRERVLLEALTRAEKALGLEHHTIHDLRHDGISMYVRRGLPAQDLSRFAGHRDLTTTLNKYYRHTQEIDPKALVYFD